MPIEKKSYIPRRLKTTQLSS